MYHKFLLTILLGLLAACSGEKETEKDMILDLAQSDMRTSTDMGKKVGEDMRQKDIQQKDIRQKDMWQKDVGTEMAQATLGKFCDPLERAGVITLSRRGEDLYAKGWVYASSDPFIGELKDSDANCKFYSAMACKPGMYGHPCTETGEKNTCIHGECSLPPTVIRNVVAIISNGTESDTLQLDADANPKSELEGENLSMEILWSGQRIIVPPMQIPEAFENLMIEGIDNFEPKNLVDLNFSWSPPGMKGSRLFTHIPINHHAYDEGTFVECEVDAAVGKLKVVNKMLKPLAVKTGLEFQSVQHLNVASAETEEGCIEIRYQFTQR